ncbi:MAG: family 16 glycoside hydrolase [Bryobacteraceae bacterium]
MKSVLLILLAAALLPAAEPNTLTPAEQAAGWKLLFDGSTMNGWRDPSQLTPKGDAWSIEGCLKANKNPRITEDLFTTGTFADFELKFEWRISPAGNSGLKYRIQDTVFLDNTKAPKDIKRFEDKVGYELEHHTASRAALAPESRAQDYVVGFEFQAIDNDGNVDGRRGGSHSSGALYDMVAPSKQTAKPVGEFNQSRLLVLGNHVEHWLNGVKVVDAQLDAPEIEKAIAGRWKGTGIYDLLLKQPKKSCPISLQNHDDVAWFRDIKIRPMSGAQAAIEYGIRTLRNVADERRGTVTVDLARQIRALPTGGDRMKLALNLANLSTEGDFGPGTLQEVADTLTAAIRAEPQPIADAFATLAQLVRYEGVTTTITDAPGFQSAMRSLEADDARRAHADFTLADLTGHTWTRSALSGKVVLVNFWATWCPPCRKEMPDLQVLQRRFGDQGLVVLAVSDEEAGKVSSYLDGKGYEFPILLDPAGKAAEAFAVNGIPKTFIFDRRGKLAAQSIDMRTQKQFLAMLAEAGLQ